MPPLLANGSLAGHFTWIDWSIVLGYLAFTTLLGGALAGRQANIRDFFLGGRKLPWYAVAGSIVATEISAVTFISVPFLVFRPGGDFTYLQLGLIGSLLARLIVGYVLVPAYYQREIYSPYDYMANRLGTGVREMTTALFALAGMLAQSARVYLTAVVLELVLREQLAQLSDITGIAPLALAIWIIGIVAIGWTIMGGITTVIWTDVILFFVFLIGAAVALATVAYHIDGGLMAVVREGHEAGKFVLWDFSTDPTRSFTVWTAAIASTWGGIGAYGTDQLMAQRMFCCRGPSEARKAIIFSWLGQLVTITVMLVGVALYVYYQHHPLEGEALAAYEEKGDRIFPIFILTVIPTGLTGLIIAGVFAAAISSLDSILAALAQTSISGFYLPWRQRRLQRSAAPVDEVAESRRTVRISRGLVILWGILLCLMAQLAERAAEFYPTILDLALAMAGYAGGALLAGFALAFVPLKITGRGYLYAAPLSVLTVFALIWHEPWANLVCWIGGGALLAAWIIAHVRTPPPSLPGWIGRTALLLAGLAIMLLLSHHGYFERDGKAVSIAWPWQAPVGSLVAFVWGWLLAEPAPIETSDALGRSSSR